MQEIIMQRTKNLAKLSETSNGKQLIENPAF